MMKSMDNCEGMTKLMNYEDRYLSIYNNIKIDIKKKKTCLIHIIIFERNRIKQ